MSMETAREFGHDVGLMENEIDRLRAELAAAQTWHMQYVGESVAEYNALADAIARVRELCAGGFTSCVRCDGVMRALGPNDGGTE